MCVPVVNVREVSVAVGQRLVSVAVCMWLARRVIRGVDMLVVVVVDMLVTVALEQVKPHADSHHKTAGQERGVSGSRTRATETTAPTNGPVEK